MIHNSRVLRSVEGRGKDTGGLVRAVPRDGEVEAERVVLCSVGMHSDVQTDDSVTEGVIS